MANVYYDADANLELIQQKRVAVIGYGSQGHAHALNMHDNGCNVVVGLPASSKSREKAEAEGLEVMTPAAAAEQADIIMILIPDQHHREVFERDFFFQAEDGIRVRNVTGVQTCALPILRVASNTASSPTSLLEVFASTSRGQRTEPPPYPRSTIPTRPPFDCSSCASQMTSGVLRLEGRRGGEAGGSRAVERLGVAKRTSR